MFVNYTGFTMDDTKKMLRAVINGQSAMKEELLGEIRKVDKKVDKLDTKIDGVEKRLTKRIDRLGKQLAYLEDDAPTREEFNELESRVDMIEQSTVSA